MSLFIRRSMSSRQLLHVLGIETSCDDTAVAVVNSDRRILYTRKYTNHSSQKEIGGIKPCLIAEQHRQRLPELVADCLNHIKVPLDAISVTTKPGFVIALKEGVSTAIKLARKNHLPLIPVHHMRAHALSAFLSHPNLKFPFVAVLLSGAHAIICLVRDVETFEIYGESLSGSPGECIDKVGREVQINKIDQFEKFHTGVAVEKLAERASENGHLRYEICLPGTSKCDMNFSSIKSSYLTIARKNMPDFCLEDFCASLQFTITRHICSKLFIFLNHLKQEGERVESVVLSGGVASNKYITNGIAKVGRAFSHETLVLPPSFCTDNAEMIAFTGCLMMEKRSKEIIMPADIPDSLYVHARFPIGENFKNKIPSHPQVRLSSSSVHGDKPVKVHDKQVYRNAER